MRTSAISESAPTKTNTAIARARLREDIRLIPALLVIGGGQEGPPPVEGRILTFDHTMVIGRRARQAPEADAHWTVPDELVSRMHCRIQKCGDEYEIVDLGSRNGTILDGIRIDKRTRLNDEAVIFVGGHGAVFRLLPENELEVIYEELKHPLGPVPSSSSELAFVCRKLTKLARSAGEILLTGETGVGKEVYARAIHDLSGRRGNFMAINCAALPSELIESELFGFTRGAHSEARWDKRGLIEEADGGTLFLDEIGDMPQELQVKLLRFLQERELTPLGSTRARRIDVRVVAATSRTAAPTSATSVGLRRDLASRLGAEAIRIPPLRYRMEDLGALVGYILKGRPWRFESPVFQAMCLYSWPGNVRELVKVVDTAEVLAEDEDLISLEHLPEAIIEEAERARTSSEDPLSRPPPTATELQLLLQRHKGNVSAISREIRRKPPLIYRWCHRFRLDPAAFRADGGNLSGTWKRRSKAKDENESPDAGAFKAGRHRDP
jgi:sigma-54 dependent transcriptional regulator, acetoin dehydrogenase operon transcriptional activator AcoR